MLTLEGAGSLLLVCLGVGILVILCCAALIFARTHLAPHADCHHQITAMQGTLENVVAWQKKAQKVKAGGAPARVTEVQEAPPVQDRVTDEQLERNAQKRLRGMLGKG